MPDWALVKPHLARLVGGLDAAIATRVDSPIL
jgi:hypothetical protein